MQHINSVIFKLKHLIFTKSDLKVGVGGPGCDAADVNGRPGSGGLLATKRNGFGGGKNVGAKGGAKELIDVSVEGKGRFHSADLPNEEVWVLLAEYSCAKRLKHLIVLHLNLIHHIIP